VYAPNVALYHYESLSRDIYDERNKDIMLKRWGKFINARLNKRIK